jgi:hypothetical protein
MFKRFRRSMRISGAGSRDLEVPQPVCHECGQNARDTNNTSAEQYDSDRYDSDRYDFDRAVIRDSWNSSSTSDSGYGGSTRHLEIEAHLDLGGDDHHPAPTIILPLPRRRPTYTSSIYSESSSYEPSPQETIVEEPAHHVACGPPVYDHLFDLPPRTFTNYSEKWKPKSRYSRLNELPAASPTAMAFPDDALEEESSAEKEPSSPEKKRMSLVLRPSSLRRLASRRTKSH